VRPAHRDNLLSELRADEWLLIEWREDETEPTKYWFSTLPEGERRLDRIAGRKQGFMNSLPAACRLRVSGELGPGGG
jgi:hypothetical protein